MQTAFCCVCRRRKLDSAQGFACRKRAGYLEDVGGVTVRAVGSKAIWVHDLSAVDSQESKPWLTTKFSRGGRVIGVGERHVPRHSRKLYIRRDQERSREVLRRRDWEDLTVTDDVVQSISGTVSRKVELNTGLC